MQNIIAMMTDLNVVRILTFLNRNNVYIIISSKWQYSSTRIIFAVRVYYILIVKKNFKKTDDRSKSSNGNEFLPILDIFFLVIFKNVFKRFRLFRNHRLGWRVIYIRIKLKTLRLKKKTRVSPGVGGGKVERIFFFI